MVDVFLINPPADQNSGDAVPLGLGCIGRVSESFGFSVRCVDMCCGDVSVEDVVDFVLEEEPIVVGVSVLSSGLPHAHQIINDLRCAGVGNIVVGGAHVTENPESVFYLGADCGLLGEADYSFPELVECIADNKELGRMNGLVYWDGNKKTIGEKQTIKAKKIPTPQRKIFNQKKYTHTPVNISRGCPHTCTYCSISCSKFRLRPQEDVIREIKELRVKHIDFIDDVFTQDSEYVEELSKTLIKEKINVKWACTTRADLINKKTLERMRNAGLWHISFGVEVGSEERRRQIGKPISDDIFEKTFNMCRRAGIKTRAYGMLGFSGESIEDMKDTVTFIKKLKPDDFVVRLTDLLPGTKLFEQAKNEGLVTEHVWEEYMLGQIPYPIYIPEGIVFKDIRRILSIK